MNRHRLVLPLLVALTVLATGTVFLASADNHGDTFYGCLYAGSLSQVNTSAPPANCGRGSQVTWNADQPVVAEDIQALIYKAEAATEVAGGAISFTANAFCEEGDTVVGGGYSVSPVSPQTGFRGIERMGEDRPIDDQDPQGWLVTGSRTVNSSGTAANAVVTVYALCVGEPPAP